MPYSPNFSLIAQAIDRLMSEFSHTKNDIGYGYRWRFANGQRVDLIDYKQKGNSIFRVGRGAWLVRQNPLLHGWFDEVCKVIAKLEIQDLATLDQKHVVGVLKILHDAPSGIGAFD